MKQQLIIVRGIPGSGKSTFASSLGIPHYEADQYFVGADGVYRFDFSKLGEAHRQCRVSVGKALLSGKSVVVSNTFTTLNELRPYFEGAKEYGIIPTVITMNGDFGSIHGVPEDKMQAMRDRFCHDISPLFEEFFGDHK
jgi:predicted kinase